MTSPTASPPGTAEPAVPEGVPLAGELATTPPLQLYVRAARTGATGLLTLQLADRTLGVHFKKGAPDFADSSHPEDTLGAFLVRVGALSREQLAQAEAQKERFGGELTGALFGLGLVAPAEAFVHFSQRAYDVLLRLLLSESGRFTFNPIDIPPHRALPLGDRWGVLSAMMRRVPGPELRRRLQPVLALPVMKAGGVMELADLRLTPQETRTVGRFDGVRSLEQLISQTPAEADTLLRLAFLLHALEVVSFYGSPAPRTSPPPPPPPGGPPPPAARPVGQHVSGPRPAVARPASPPGGVAPVLRPTTPPAGPPPVLRPSEPAPAPQLTPVPPVAARATPAPGATPPPVRSSDTRPPPAAQSNDPDVVALRGLRDKLKEQNHFERLGVAESADTAAIKVAYFKLARVHHPDTAPAGAPPELLKLKEDVFALIGEAYRTIGEDAPRAEYLQVLKSGGDAEVDLNNIFKAEELFQRACAMVKARRYVDGHKLLEEAISLHAEEGEFYAWRGYARFLSQKDSKEAKAEALKDIEEALKRNERCVQAYFFLGQVTKLGGDPAGSLKHFKKAVELQPHHIDAAREVRLLTQKK